MFTMSDLFEIAIQMELNGEATYIKSIEKTKDPELKKLLKWMANEEARHAQWFSTNKNSIQVEVAEANLKQMVPGVLQNMMGDNTLDLEDVDFESFTTISELLNTFIGFEKETITFYQLLEMFVDTQEAKESLQTILDEEKAHINKLETMAASTCETLN